MYSPSPLPACYHWTRGWTSYSAISRSTWPTKSWPTRVAWPASASQVEQRPAPAAASAVLNDISQRDTEVLRLLTAGKSNREIADVLCISLNMVATHVRNILAKTGAANRTEAAAYAMRHGYLAN